MTEYAYAKVNLYLDVISRRDDGFHGIKSVMHSLSLCDKLDVSVAECDEKRIRLVGNCDNIPCDESNLVYRAAKLYLEENEICSEINIELCKNIPISAGLAGGSSDAAATLRALNQIFGAMTDAELSLLAARLGSDVPYCLVGGTAVCTGRGEIVTPIESDLKLNCVIAIGDDRISTPMAYSRLDTIYSNFDGSVASEGELCYEKLIEALTKGGEVSVGLYNIFETDIDEIANSVTKIKAEMLRLGAKVSMMSGSGPSVFGVFETEGEALLAKDTLQKKGFKAFFATSV